MKNWDDWLFRLGLLAIIVNLGWFIWEHRESYKEKFDIAQYERIYKYSQYNVPENEFRGNIDDPELFSLAGYKYITGADPSEINFEQQPLAKYFFGISILLSGNGAIIQLLVGLALLVFTYFLARELVGRTLALLPVLLLSLDPLFREQLYRVYLDLFLTLNSTIFLLLLWLSLKKEKLRSVTMFWVGIVLLSKSWLFAPMLGIFLLGFLWFYNKELVADYAKRLIWTGLAYIFGYLVYFFYHSPLDWIILHVNQLRLYKSYVPEYPKGEIWRIIFAGEWRKWFGDFGLAKVDTWSIVWPIATVGLLVAIYYAVKSSNKMALLLVFWSLIWLLTISSRLVFPRYLLPALPPLFILLVYSTQHILQRKNDIA